MLGIEIIKPGQGCCTAGLTYSMLSRWVNIFVGSGERTKSQIQIEAAASCNGIPSNINSDNDSDIIQG